MRGTYFLGADKEKRFETREMNFPQELADDQVLVRVMACGVCGTDVHIYHGHKGSAQVDPPVVLGHEFAGIVEAVGPKVRTVSPGDHVTMDPNIYCGQCRPCRMGKKQNCEHLEALGVTMNGGFAEYCLAPESQCFLVDSSLPFDVAAMAEPLACAIHGMDLAGIIPGQTVLVIGGGAIGQMMLQLAKIRGAARVLLSEPAEVRRQLGLSLGADGAIDPIHEDLNEAINRLTGLDGVDVVLECVGNTIAVSQAIKAAGRGGHIVLFSVPAPDATVSLPLFDVYNKELSLTGSMINPDTHLRAVELLNSGRLHIQELITHSFGLTHLEDAIVMQMSDQSVKVMVHPQED